MDNRTDSRIDSKLIFELSVPGRKAYSLPDCDVPEVDTAAAIPDEYLRQEAPKLPEVSEVDVMRHFTRLSLRNHGVDTGFYPLGSCTMKYNPKINEDVVRLDGFAAVHPLQDESTVQGSLKVIYDTGCMLGEIAGMDGFTLQPAAGAHGELTGLMIMKAWHEHRGDTKRTRVIVPDSAHGTNPASAATAGFDVVEIKSAADGGVDIEALRAAVDDTVAGLMLTNPSTLGLFEERIREVADIIHGAGGLLYYDGANANAIMGICRPGDMGFDIVHINLHKTFSTPHGGGGPGSGPVGVKKDLIPFLPSPVVVKRSDGYSLDYDRPLSIGPVKSFYGNFGVVVRAYTYMRMMGAGGLKEASETAVLNANYLMHRLKDAYELAYDRTCMHEFVLSAVKQKQQGASALDIAKRLLDFGIHAPTIYFPLIVKEAMMVEPTETESKEMLDKFAEVMLQIAREAEEQPELLHGAPYNIPVSRLDETRAARTPILRR